jgi:ADP-heptose:LPS heptosyltransferase
MILGTHGSMGDVVIMTGIPQAYFELFGEKTKIVNKYASVFWDTNPYITEENIGNTCTIRDNMTKEDYMQYYPQRVFKEITGISVDREKIQPNLYKERTPIPRFVIMNDQSGWPSRRGYRYFNNLASRLIQEGFLVYYLRNNRFRDCIGRFQIESINTYTNRLDDLSIPQTIDWFSRASFYIGYESGLSTLAGALKVPYITFYGSIFPINTTHDSCIYYIDNCDHCCKDQCSKNCLTFYEDMTDPVMERIKEYDKSESLYTHT